METWVQGRRWVAGLLVIALLLGSSLPGRAAEIAETEETRETHQETEETRAEAEGTTETAENEPESTIDPAPESVSETTEESTPETTEESIPETVEATVLETSDAATEPETVPEQTAAETEGEPSLFERLLIQMQQLEQESEGLPADVAVLDAFTARLREAWNGAYDAQEQGLITESELAVLDDLGWKILDCLKQNYRYENGEIQPLGIRRFGSRETPLEATAQNSVQTLGSGSGIKFRIFNYTNGKDGSGNYIGSGGINDNGLDGYFNFRGSSYENTAADGSRVGNFTNTVTDVDGYTANHATVLANLGADGYPVFDGSRDGGPRKSLGYLFGAGGRGVTGYSPVNTLLRQNSRGQYYYNSADNAADFDIANNRFVVRTYRERGMTTAGQGTGQYYDFFPFTYWDGTTKADASTAKWYNYNNTEEVDYWYGMTMEATFSMPGSGLVQGEQMVFSFSGDDDVWVFLDDVLVLDLGGTHGVVSGSINFATGQVKQYLDWGGSGETSSGTSYPTTLKTRFAAAGKEPNGGWNGDVFADYSQHTIRFYYLERATSCANCKILFNMPILPTGKLRVEKAVEGALTETTAPERYGFQLQGPGGTAAAGVSFDRIGTDGAVLERGLTDSQGGFNLLAGQQAVFGLTVGKEYRVLETDSGLYAKPLRCTVDGVMQERAAETGWILLEPESEVQAVFVNKLATTSFSLRKQVEGNLGDRDQEFCFQVHLFTGNPETGGGAIPFPEGAGYTAESGAADFSLKHGETLTLSGIPMGAWVRVTEALSDGYEIRYVLPDTEIAGQSVCMGPLNTPVQLTCINRREGVIDTGLVLDRAPYLWMTAGSVLLRRKKRRLYE